MCLPGTARPPTRTTRDRDDCSAPVNSGSQRLSVPFTPVTRLATRARILGLTQEALGYDHLRPGQAEAIAAILAGRDTLAVLPTGLGKSAIYQVGGPQIAGLTVVVSPLVALQRDQVESVAERDL